MIFQSWSWCLIHWNNNYNIETTNYIYKEIWINCSKVKYMHCSFKTIQCVNFDFHLLKLAMYNSCSLVDQNLTVITFPAKYLFLPLFLIHSWKHNFVYFVICTSTVFVSQTNIISSNTFLIHCFRILLLFCILYDYIIVLMMNKYV